MEAVEFRFVNGFLEYRTLIIHERDTYGLGGEPDGDQLYLEFSENYTYWKRIPNIWNTNEN